MALDKTYYMPLVLQAVAGENYDVYAYIDDGTVRLVNVSDIVTKGIEWAPLKDYEIFKSTITVLNGTVAWDLSGKHDPCNCLDIDPCILSDSPIVSDPLHTNN